MQRVSTVYRHHSHRSAQSLATCFTSLALTTCLCACNVSRRPELETIRAQQAVSQARHQQESATEDARFRRIALESLGGDPTRLHEGTLAFPNSKFNLSDFLSGLYLCRVAYDMMNGVGTIVYRVEMGNRNVSSSVNNDFRARFEGNVSLVGLKHRSTVLDLPKDSEAFQTGMDALMKSGGGLGKSGGRMEGVFPAYLGDCVPEISSLPRGDVIFSGTGIIILESPSGREGFLVGEKYPSKEPDPTPAPPDNRPAAESALEVLEQCRGTGAVDDCMRQKGYVWVKGDTGGKWVEDYSRTPPVPR